MQLGSKSKQPSAYAQVLQEENVIEPATTTSASTSHPTSSSQNTTGSIQHGDIKEGR